MDIDEPNTSYFRYYYEDIFNNVSQCQLFDAVASSSSHMNDHVVTSDDSGEGHAESNTFDMQLKFARMIFYGAQKFVITRHTSVVEEEKLESSSFLSDTTLSFLQIVFFITLICLIRQYLNIRIVKEEPIRLINKTGEYDAYDLVPDTPLNRKASQKNNVSVQQKSEKLREKHQIQVNLRNNHHLINNDLFTERETILLLNKLNAAASNAMPKKKYNTDKFVTNKRKCTSVGPVMNTSCEDNEVTLPVKDEKFAAMLERNIQQQQQHDENMLTCACEANWRQAVLMHHQNEAAIYNNMCVYIK